MRKQAAFLVVMLTLGLVFAGAVSAQDVEVAVINEDGSLVDVTCPGDEVAAEVNVTPEDSDLVEPVVFITVDPETGLTFEPEKAFMFYNGFEYDNDNLEFFFWDSQAQSWVWLVALFDADYTMEPGDEALLIAPAIVTDCGPITVNAALDAFESEEILDSDSYQFLSKPCRPCHHGHGKVPMQNTGTPVALAALGLLGIIGGTVYSRLR